MRASTLSTRQKYNKKSSTKFMFTQIIIACFMAASSIILIFNCFVFHLNQEDTRKIIFDLERKKLNEFSRKSFSSPMKNKRYHMVFSTGCSGNQHWPSFLLFHSAFKLGYKGTITRVASGCDKKAEKAAKKWHKKHIQEAMSKDFHIHFTPDYSISESKTGDKYVYFNKPFGLQHWMKHGKAMDYDKKKKELRNKDDITILLDPDMLILQPLPSILFEENFQLQPGTIYAQCYLLSDAWLDFDLEYITQNKNTPALNVTKKEALKSHQVGLPAVGLAQDFYRLVNRWCEVVPSVNEEYDDLLGEMFAYVIAAADLGIKHKQMTSLMISHPLTTAKQEDWSYIDQFSLKESCKVGLGEPPKKFIKQGKKLSLPYTLHYCQVYGLGKWVFYKTIFPFNFFSCDSPLLTVPHKEMAFKYDRFYVPNHEELFDDDDYDDDEEDDDDEEHQHNPDKHKDVVKDFSGNDTRRKREAFSLCSLIHSLNEASMFYKESFCEDPNLEETMRLHQVITEGDRKEYTELNLSKD